MGRGRFVASAPTTEILLRMSRKYTQNPGALREQRVSDRTHGIRARRGSVESHAFQYSTLCGELHLLWSHHPWGTCRVSLSRHPTTDHCPASPVQVSG